MRAAPSPPCWRPSSRTPASPPCFHGRFPPFPLAGRAAVLLARPDCPREGPPNPGDLEQLNCRRHVHAGVTPPSPLLAHYLPSADRTLLARLGDGLAALTTSRGAWPRWSSRSSWGRCSSWSVACGWWGEGRRTVGIKTLFFTAASRAMASKNSDPHAMLNAIQHGVTIANLRIQRKEQQFGLRNIRDRGEGLNHVGEKLALVVLSLCSHRKGFWLFLAPKNEAQK
jgi:hypothetical protein